MIVVTVESTDACYEFLTAMADRTEIDAADLAVVLLNGLADMATYQLAEIERRMEA